MTSSVFQSTSFTLAATLCKGRRKEASYHELRVATTKSLSQQEDHTMDTLEWFVDAFRTEAKAAATELDVGASRNESPDTEGDNCRPWVDGSS